LYESIGELPVSDPDSTGISTVIVDSDCEIKIGLDVGTAGLFSVN